MDCSLNLIVGDIMNKTKKITTTALLCALAYIATFFGRLPISTVGFLKYDPKDVIVVIGGFIFGPLTAVVISVIVAVIEMITISDTNIIGCIMNIASTVSFALTASVIYERSRSIKGAVAGLIFGIFAVTVTMVVWNYALTPIFYKMPRKAVAEMLLPIFVPFNLIKSSLNTALTLLLYKPFVKVLRRSGLIEQRQEGANSIINKGVIFLALFLIVMSVGALLIIN